MHVCVQVELDMQLVWQPLAPLATLARKLLCAPAPHDTATGCAGASASGAAGSESKASSSTIAGLLGPWATPMTVTLTLDPRTERVVHHR